MTIEKGSITGSGYDGTKNVTGKGYAASTPIVAVGLGCRPRWRREAFETSSRNLIKKYLIVTPETPQMVVWVVPGNELTYQVESNTHWIVK